MSFLLASNVISSGQIIWLLFAYIGIPILLVIGAVVLIVLAGKTNPPKPPPENDS